MASADYRILPAGDAALVVEFGLNIDRALNARVLALAHAVARDEVDGVIETVPTFRSLMICFEPERIGFRGLAERVPAWIAQAAEVEAPSRLLRLPVCYDIRVAPDLQSAAERLGLAPAEIAARHSAVAHHVYMLGFLPGQPYLGDLPPQLALPRLTTPRLSVPAGSVGIAMTMTCVFPRPTPCGLNVIGRTPVRLWSARDGERNLLAPGDTVVFDPISLAEFEAQGGQV